jgi:hypothetical protein
VGIQNSIRILYNNPAAGIPEVYKLLIKVPQWANNIRRIIVKVSDHVGKSAVLLKFPTNFSFHRRFTIKYNNKFIAQLKFLCCFRFWRHVSSPNYTAPNILYTHRCENLESHSIVVANFPSRNRNSFTKATNTLRSLPWKSHFILRRYWIQIYTRRPAVPTDVFVVLLSLSRKIPA